MHVIIRAADRQDVKSAITRNAAHVGPERPRTADELRTAFRGKHAMHVIENVGSGHGSVAAPRLRRIGELVTAG